MRTYNFYYDEPTQVTYKYNNKKNYGIAYHDVVIDAYFGEIIELADIFLQATQNKISIDDAVLEYSWADLRDIIKKG